MRLRYQTLRLPYKKHSFDRTEKALPNIFDFSLPETFDVETREILLSKGICSQRAVSMQSFSAASCAASLRLMQSFDPLLLSSKTTRRRSHFVIVLEMVFGSHEDTVFGECAVSAGWRDAAALRAVHIVFSPNRLHGAHLQLA